MEHLINWGLSAIDSIYSATRGMKGDSPCPAGTFVAGYIRDSWRNWQPMCLESLSVEDIEDLYILAIMIPGFLMIGLGIALVYRKIKKTESPRMIEGSGDDIMVVTQKLDKVIHNLAALQKKYEDE